MGICLGSLEFMGSGIKMVSCYFELVLGDFQ